MRLSPTQIEWNIDLCRCCLDAWSYGSNSNVWLHLSSAINILPMQWIIAQTRDVCHWTTLWCLVIRWQINGRTERANCTLIISLWFVIPFLDLYLLSINCTISLSSGDSPYAYCAHVVICTCYSSVPEMFISITQINKVSFIHRMSNGTLAWASITYFARILLHILHHEESNALGVGVLFIF